MKTTLNNTLIIVFCTLGFSSPSLASACPPLSMLIKFDQDNSFDFDYNEYLLLAKKRFADFDKNHDGTLFASELPTGRIPHPIFKKHMRTHPSKGEYLSQKQLHKPLADFFKFVDRNGNQKVGVIEYWRLCRSKWLF